LSQTHFKPLFGLWIPDYNVFIILAVTCFYTTQLKTVVRRTICHKCVVVRTLKQVVKTIGQPLFLSPAFAIALAMSLLNGFWRHFTKVFSMARARTSLRFTMLGRRSRALLLFLENVYLIDVWKKRVAKIDWSPVVSVSLRVGLRDIWQMNRDSI
jgi:hypothetical protein